MKIPLIWGYSTFAIAFVFKQSTMTQYEMREMNTTTMYMKFKLIVSKINFQVTKWITHVKATEEMYQWSVVLPLGSIGPSRLLHIQKMTNPWNKASSTHFQKTNKLKYLFFYPALYIFVLEYTTSGKCTSDSNAKANKQVKEVQSELYKVGNHSAK